MGFVRVETRSLPRAVGLTQSYAGYPVVICPDFDGGEFYDQFIERNSELLDEIIDVVTGPSYAAFIDYIEVKASWALVHLRPRVGEIAPSAPTVMLRAEWNPAKMLEVSD